jgi:membrane protein implicated in regulation of membrane protease activity
MDAGSDAWQWFWLAAVVNLAQSEIITPFLFFMISFALGAALAAVAAFLGAALVVQWTLFVVGSGVSLGLLAPLGRRMAREASDDDHEGAMRWVGRLAVVIEPIPGGASATGLVRLERTRWRAESPRGVEIPEGTTVRVLSVKGTRLIVVPSIAGNLPPTATTGPAQPQG